MDMKKYISKIVMAGLLAGGVMLSSCNDYLSVVPKGEKIPTTLADFEALLRDEYNCQRVDVLQELILLNDRYVSSSNLSYYPLYSANYNWDESADRIKLNDEDEGTYYTTYSSISTCNLIIENAASMTETTDTERKALVAQAKVLRAMNYFTLVNYYSDTYTDETAAQKGGVPVILSANINAPYTQPSVKEVYDFILEDMEEAYNDLPEKAQTILHPDRATADAFYARLYLQMGNYDKALEYADKALEANDALFDWVDFYRQYESVIEDSTDFNTSLPSPMGFDYVENYDFRHGSTSYSTTESGLTLDRASRFEKGDARMAARWKLRDMGDVGSYYVSTMRGYFNYGGMTTVEVYFIKAECLAREGQYQEAMDLVNKVRQTRILPEVYTPLSASGTDEAVRLIIRTKANEMIQTQVPFIDARRLNAEGKYPVTLTKTVDGKTLTLSPDSHLWTMPFPQGAVKNPGNGSITQNVSK